MREDGDLNPKLVRAFLAIEQEGSFAKAAQRLHVSQSVLSRAISELEARVGEAVFHRTRNRLTLTVAGHVFLPYARKVEAAHADLATGIAAWRAKQSGKLKFICSDVILPALLPRLLETFGTSIADKTFEFADASSQDVIASVSSGESDLGICLHLGDLPCEVLQIPLLQAPLGVLSTSDFHRPEVIQTIDDISGIPMAFHSEDSIMQRALVHNLHDLSKVPLPAIVSMNAAAMYAMVTSGRVAAMTLATSTCHPIAKDLIFTPISSFERPILISAIYPAHSEARAPDMLSIISTAMLQLPWHPSVGVCTLN